MKSLKVFIAALAASLLPPSNLAKAQWADLEFNVLFKGRVPVPKMVPAPQGLKKIGSDHSKDPAFGTPLEDLVVHPENNGLANVVFTLDTRRLKPRGMKIHPDLVAVPDEKVVLEIFNHRFVPHVFTVRAGQTIEVRNRDPMPHNVNFPISKANALFNPVVQANGTLDVVTQEAERSATRVSCNIYPWMSAYLLVTDHPYIGISDENGRVLIKNLPAETTLEFKVWHASQDGTIDEVYIDGNLEKWKRGTKVLKLKPGNNHLGDVLIDANQFRIR